MTPPLFALWFAALSLVVFGMPVLDAWSRGRPTDIAAGGPVDVPAPRPGAAPLSRRAVDLQVSTLPVAPHLLFQEDDPLYRAIRSGLPLDTPREHDVTCEILRRVRALGEM